MNRVIHFEIHANDLSRAIEFYKKVFGWDFEKWENSGQEYWMVMTAPKDSKDPGINGGLLLRGGKEAGQGVGPNAFVCSIIVENIDDTISLIEQTGGICQMPKFMIADMAWQAYYKDTEDNIFGIHQPIKKDE